MKRITVLIATILLCIGFMGCSKKERDTQIVATTLPVYEFTEQLCRGTDITVTRLVTENISCLHDYTLQVQQMCAVENAEYVVISGAGLEAFMEDILLSANNVIDASKGIELQCSNDEHDDGHHGHSHEKDPHIWLSPARAKTMAHNICNALITAYPEFTDVFLNNSVELDKTFDALISYAAQQLGVLHNREIVTFHDGFIYMAEAFDLTILHAIEEESGAEASSAELIKLIKLVNAHGLQEIFIETNGSNSAASIISAETGADIYTLDMAIAGDSYFNAMYHNIDTLKEALQ